MNHVKTYVPTVSKTERGWGAILTRLTSLDGHLLKCPLLKKTVAFCFLYFLSSAYFFSQTVYSIDEYLSTATSDETVVSQQEQLDFLKNADYDLPIARGLEFRTETDEMNYGRQEYLLRYRYNPLDERKAHKKLHQSNIHIMEAENRILIEEALLNRYHYIIEYFALLREIDLMRQQKEVADDLLYVLQRKAINNSGLDLSDLLSAENRVHELELGLLEKNNEIELLANIIKKPLGTKRSNIALDTSQVMPIQVLRGKMNQLPIIPVSNPVFTKRELDIEKNELDYKYDQSRNDWKIDFVQIKYSGRDNLNFGREISFGAGVEIPLKNLSKLDKNDYLLDKIELENRLQMQRNSLAEKMEKSQKEIEAKFQQLDLIQQQLDNSQAQFSLENYPRTSGADPVVILNIKSNILKRKANRLAIEKDIYQLYLELLEMSGKVTELPLKNYLTADWHSFK